MMTLFPKSVYRHDNDNDEDKDGNKDEEDHDYENDDNNQGDPTTNHDNGNNNYYEIMIITRVAPLQIMSPTPTTPPAEWYSGRGLQKTAKIEIFNKDM